MPSWGQIAAEINSTPATAGASSFDIVRRKYLAALNAHTKRPVILYASRWIQGFAQGQENAISINDEDVHGLMEAIHALGGTDLDLILHSPGGSPEAAEGMVKYIRAKFKHVRVLVPQLAMSAATMIACSANEVVLGSHSFLGPTDPQMVLQTPTGRRIVPAQALLAQFDMARDDAKTAFAPVWAPIIPQYGPDLIVTAENACRMTDHMVRKWLAEYMFANLPRPAARRNAKRLAQLLNDHDRMFTHGRHLGIDELQKKGMRVARLEADKVTQDAVLSIYHAVALVFMAVPAALKVIENHLGNAYVKMAPMPAALPAAPTPPKPPTQAAPAPAPTAPPAAPV